MLSPFTFLGGPMVEYSHDKRAARVRFSDLSKRFFSIIVVSYLFGAEQLGGFVSQTGNFQSFTSSRHTPEKVPHIALGCPVVEYTLETRASGFEYVGLHDFPWGGSTHGEGITRAA